MSSATICVLSCSAVSAQLVRQSVTATGAQAQAGGRSAAVSADGRHIAFVSGSPDLVANDTNGVDDIFVRHRDTGVVTRVSVRSDGTAATAASYRPAISADGRFVAFCSAATLTAADTNSNEDVYLRDLGTGTTILVTATPAGTASDSGGCTGLDLSADGRYVAFVSAATNLVANDSKPAEDVFVWDRTTHAIELVSVSSANGAANERSRGTVSISADGRYVAFMSYATNLVTPSSNGAQHAFVRDRQAGVTRQVSVATSGAQASQSSGEVAIAGDGRYVAFSSGATNLDAADTDPESDIFVHDLVTKETRLVSRSRPGAISGTAGTPSISDDGRFVTFVANEAFVAGAQSGVWYVYLYDLLTARMRIVSVRNDGTVATGSNTVAESAAGAISGDGRYVVFHSWANLVAGDTNGTADVYMLDAMYWRFQRYPAAGAAGRLSTDGTLLSWQYVPSTGTSASFYADLRGIGQMTLQVQSRPAPPPPRGFQGFPSGDGRAVAFVSDAASAGDTNGVSDVFVLDRSTFPGVVTRESVSSTGALANGRSDTPVLSADGRYLAFLSAATNLVPNDTNGVTDAFVRDRQTGQTQRVSLSSAGAAANAGTFGVAISGDGRFVVLASDASNLVADDTNNRGDVFVHDRQTLQTTRISLTAAGGQAADGSYIGTEAVSVDGRYVAFMSFAALVPEDTNGSLDVYVRDRQANTVSRVSVSTTGAQTGGLSFEGSAIENDNASMSSDGRYVAFQSSADTLTAADGNQHWDVFVRDRVLGTTTRVEVLSDVLGQGDARTPHISGNGCCVAFEYTESIAGGTSTRHVVTRERAPVLTGVSPSSVPNTGGTSMTLTGEGFTFGLPAPRIALISADGTTDQLISPTSATFVDPPHPGFTGVADVSVSDASFRSTLARAVAIATPPPPPTVTLTVQKSGAGAGTVSGGGITCGTTCSADVPVGTTVSLVASAAVGSTFTGWSQGACLTTTCDVTLTTALTVTATFTTVALPGDTDGDSLPDVWEQRFGLNAASATASDGPEGDPDGDGIGNAAELAAGSHPRGTFRRFLAEGASTSFLSTTIAVLNTSDAPASTLFQLLSAGKAAVTVPVTIAAGARYTFDPRSVLGSADTEFSTLVEADRLLVVDRTMTWDGSGYGSHAETAVASPSPIWYLAEGATLSGFDLFYLLQNPTDTPTTVRVRYLRGNGAPLEKTYALPPSSRTNIWVNVEDFPGLGRALASAEVSAVFESLDATPFIVERAMYLSSQGRTFNAGHASMGVTRPASEWFLAEGATGPYFDLFVLIANPNDQDAAIVVTYLLGDGTTYSRTMTAPANSRSGIWVDQEQIDGVPGRPLADVAVSTTVKSTNGVPIIVERAMWWPGDGSTWHEAHNSSGSRTAGTRWALAEGEVGGARQLETYILIANTSALAGNAAVTLHFEDGTTATRDYVLAPHSRTNVPVMSDFPSAQNRRFGAVVESTGATPADIVVERAMYSNAAGVQWAAGTNALATRLDGIGELALYAAPGDPLVLDAFLPDGAQITFAADKLPDGTPAALRQITTKNPAGGTAEFVLDASGRPVRATTPNGVVFDFAWESDTTVNVTVTDSANGTTLTFPVTVPATATTTQLAAVVEAAPASALVTAPAETEKFGTSDVTVTRCGQPYDDAEVTLSMSGGGFFGRELSAARVPDTPGLYRARVPIKSSAAAVAVGEFCDKLEGLVSQYCDLYEAVPDGPVQRVQLYEAVCTQLSVMLAETAVLAPEAALLFTACQAVIAGSEIACTLNADFGPDGLHQIPPGGSSLFEQSCKVAAPVTDFFLRGDVRLLPVAIVERARYTTDAKESSADGEFNGKFPSFEIKIDADEATTVTSVTPTFVPAYSVTPVTIRGTGLRNAQVVFGFDAKAVALRHASDGKSMEVDIKTTYPTERIHEEHPELAPLAMGVLGKCSGAFARVTVSCPPAPVITKLLEPKVISETATPFGPNRTFLIGFEGKYLSGATGPTGKLAAGTTKVEFTIELSPWQDRVPVTLRTECGAETNFEVFVGAASPGGP